MKRRSFAQGALASALSLTLPGGTALAGSDARQWSRATPAASPGSAAGALTFGEGRSFAVDGQPVAMSPDGKWLAGPGPEHRFIIWDVETITPIVATSDAPLMVHTETITWAPDSSAVAFSLDAARMMIDSDIIVMETDGTLHDLTDDGFAGQLSLERNALEVLVDIYPAWSPDSQELIFARSEWSNTNRNTTLAAIGRDGKGVSERFAVTDEESLVIYSPMHWLDDGSVIFSILFPSDNDDQNGVWRLTPDGDTKRILVGDADAELPAPFVNDVSPDGTLATVMSYTRIGQLPTGPEPVYCLLDLDSGAILPLQTTDPTYPMIVHIDAPGSFTPDGSSVLSLEREGDRGRIVQSDLQGNVLTASAFPDGTKGPSTLRGFSVAANNTLFMPTVLDGENRQYGGIIVPFE